jgi:hypothetical protein
VQGCDVANTQRHIAFTDLRASGTNEQQRLDGFDNFLRVAVNRLNDMDRAEYPAGQSVAELAVRGGHDGEEAKVQEVSEENH